MNAHFNQRREKENQKELYAFDFLVMFSFMSETPTNDTLFSINALEAGMGMAILLLAGFALFLLLNRRAIALKLTETTLAFDQLQSRHAGEILEHQATRQTLAALEAAENTRKEERTLADQKAREELEALQKKFEESFKAHASDVLSQSQKQLLTQANETFAKQQEKAQGNLNSLVAPMKESLGKFDQKVKEIEHNREQDKLQIGSQLKSVSDELKRAHQITSDLKNTLSSPKGLGDWGEREVELILERSGLSRFHAYKKQVHVQGRDGGLRPDFVLYMSGMREIALDSKVSLSDYQAAIQADSEQEQARHLQAHANKVKAHIQRLSKKDYGAELENSLDFVVMFIPGDHFYFAALEIDPGLFDYAMQQNVVVVTPSNLVALAKIVENSWRQEAIVQNMSEAAGIAKELYHRFGTLNGHVESLSKRINGVVETFNKMNGSMASSVWPQIRRFEDLSLDDARKSIKTVDDVETQTVVKPIRHDALKKPKDNVLALPSGEEASESDTDQIGAEKNNGEKDAS